MDDGHLETPVPTSQYTALRQKNQPPKNKRLWWLIAGMLSFGVCIALGMLFGIPFPQILEAISLTVFSIILAKIVDQMIEDRFRKPQQ